MRSARAWLWTLALGGALTLPARAHASPDFPHVIQTEEQLPAEPPCTLCHAPGTPGLGTVVTYFGRTMLSLGVSAQNDGSLRAALAQDDAEQIDSDGDGIPDIEELRAGSDPNDGPGNHLPVPETGCALAPAGHASGRFAAFAWLVLTAVARLRCKRRAS